MKTAEGMVEFAAPQVRDTSEPFVSEIRENLTGRTQALEDLAVELYARGLSTRDVEDAFTDQSGRRLLSRAAVSEITEGCGRSTSLLSSAICPSIGSSTSASMGPSGFTRINRVRRCSPPGALGKMAARFCPI
jgi:Transposase, Mutator family